MTVFYVVAGSAAVIILLILLSGIRFISNSRIGIVEKRFSFKGSIKSGFIALNGEAGFQPKVLRGGLHYLIPVQYVVRMAPLVTIPQGKIGYIFARDGKLLEFDTDSCLQCRSKRLSGCGSLLEERWSTRSSTPHSS